MTYQVLARKWRPKSFAELAGQAHVVQALTNALTRGRLHHAYLLTGTRGVGKTTIARILAKSLNCITNGVTATPCGTCAACLDIDAGRFVDLLELDAASNTGIDNMREILDNARYAPTVGRYKVYLIDEVHMLSKAAFNSMLKTLEEPPEHVRFVLATTDPQKIPVTVLSRCLQFNLKQLPVALIEERLASVLAAEEIAADPRALALVARAAQGSMRDALSLLDQAIAYGSGEVREPAVRAMLGAVDTQHVYRLADALLAGDGPALLAEVDALSARSIAFASALEELASLYHRIATVQAVPAAAQATDDGERVAAYAAAMSPELVQLAYQICVQGRADLPLAPDEATGFAMTLLRLLAFEPGGGAGKPAAVDGAPRQRAAPGPRPASAAAVSLAPSTAGPVPAAAPTRAPARRQSSRGTRCRIGDRCRARCARCRRRTGGRGRPAGAGASHGSGRLAGIRRRPAARRHRRAARGADRAPALHRPRARAGRAGRAAASHRQGLRRQAEGRARRGHRDEGPARVRGVVGGGHLARRAGAARARGAQGPHRSPVPRRAVRARRRRALRRDDQPRFDQARFLNRSPVRAGSPVVRRGAAAPRGVAPMMKNQLAGLMKQAQQMQDNLKKAQEDLARIEVEGQSGAGMVKVLMTCRHDVKRVTIDPSLLTEDRDMLEDLVAAAVNDAVRRVEATTQEKMAGLTMGMPMPPGMKLPF